VSVFVICEAGVSNYGDVGLALRQVDAAAAARADAVKFQVWETASLVSRRAAAEHAEELGHDWYARMEERRLDRAELREVQAHATERGIPFLATAHDPDALAFLVEELDVPMLKVGSGEASNWRFLELVGSAARPVLVSFGLQTDDEAVRAVETLREAGAPEITALHCLTLYPTPPQLARLDRIARLRELLGIPIGISDHSVGSHVALAAVALGAEAVEKHLTFDKNDPRSLDNAGALEPAEWVEFVRQIREVEQALAGDGDPGDALAASRAWALQSVVAARPLEAGAVVREEDVAFKRPALGGIPASEIDRVIGRRLRRALAADEQIRRDDLDTDERA
jgi:N-acetylneuraminate synthase/N,N'-diacetyllegionaminate synthase